eukprot:g2052.t1
MTSEVTEYHDDDASISTASIIGWSLAGLTLLSIMFVCYKICKPRVEAVESLPVTTYPKKMEAQNSAIFTNPDGALSFGQITKVESHVEMISELSSCPADED